MGQEFAYGAAVWHEDRPWAIEDRCPHLGFQLSQGDLDGCTLTCANHQWEFDALTGQGTNPGNCQLTMFGTRVRAGQIEILAPGPD